MCDNYTFISSQNDDAGFPNFNKYTAPYYSASRKTLIVVYCEPDDILNVNFTIVPTKYRGVFINPCSNVWFAKVLSFPSSYADKILSYQYPFLDDKDFCLTVLISSKYFLADPQVFL